jgi:hypothetical protein
MPAGASAILNPASVACIPELGSLKYRRQAIGERGLFSVVADRAKQERVPS